MDAGTIASSTTNLPTWAYFALLFLGNLCGIFFMFVLGFLAKRNEGRDSADAGLGAHHPDCANCAPIRRVEGGLIALNGRIDTLLLEFGKQGGK